MPDRESLEENARDLSQTLFASVHFIIDVVKLLFHVVIIIIESIFRCFIPVPRKSVEGEVVVITGAGHGLGRQLALNFATLGAKVVLLDINQENILVVQQEIKVRGEIAFAFKCDVSIEKQVEELGEKIRREIGNVCILINNAGIMSGKPIMYLHSHQIRKTLEVNILAHFWMIRCFLPELLDSGRGQIVAISSIAGLLGCANLTDYCASKFAVIGLMRALREDLYAEGKEDNIVLTTVCPSTIKTGMVEKPRSRFPSLFPIMDIKTTARIITDGILRNENTIIIPSTSKFAHTVFSLLPLKAAVLLQRFVDYSMDPNIY